MESSEHSDSGDSCDHHHTHQAVGGVVLAVAWPHHSHHTTHNTITPNLPHSPSCPSCWRSCPSCCWATSFPASSRSSSKPISFTSSALKMSSLQTPTSSRRSLLMKSIQGAIFQPHLGDCLFGEGDVSGPAQHSTQMVTELWRYNWAWVGWHWIFECLEHLLGNTRKVMSAAPPSPTLGTVLN